MTGTEDGRDPVELAIAFTRRLSDQALPADTAAKLRGERPMSPADRVQVAAGFRGALASPALTGDQRGQLRSLLGSVTRHDPALAAVVDATEAGRTHRAPADSPAARPAAEPVSPRRRRWPRIVVAAFVVAALGTTSSLAWANYRSGQDWRQRAAAAQADVERLTLANDTLASDLDDLGESLRRSESDVALLEKRASRAGNARARAEDEREMANAYAERITEIALAYDEVAQWFSACRTEQSTLTTMVFDFEDYYVTGQTHLVSNQISRAADTCGTAEGYLADLRAYVQALSP